LGLYEEYLGNLRFSKECDQTCAKGFFGLSLGINVINEVIELIE
jgi:hypothetical protein